MYDNKFIDAGFKLDIDDSGKTFLYLDSPPLKVKLESVYIGWKLTIDNAWMNNNRYIYSGGLDENKTFGTAFDILTSYYNTHVRKKDGAGLYSSY